MYQDEFDKIQKASPGEKNKDHAFFEVMNQCLERLSFQEQVELRSYLERQLRQVQLKQR